MTQRLSGISAIGSLALATIVAGTFVGYGCGDDEPITPTPDAPTTSGPDAGVVAGTYSHYVTSELVTGPDPSVYAFDLDGDDSVDNQIGAILLVLKPLGFDADMTLSTAVNAGTIVVLHSVKAASLASGAATWQVYIGDPKDNPDLTSGNGMFTIASDSPTSAIVPGTITAGTFSGGPADVTLKLALIEGAEPLTLLLHDAHLEADVTAAGCTNGKLGGGITQTDLTSIILPALVMALNDRIDADGTCHEDPTLNACNASNKSLLSTLDHVATGNSDNHIQVAEIQNHPVIGNALKPDVDILLANGQLGKDGTKESLSIGVGFTCNKAVFTASSEH
jgi:hypothetical protein